jgi:hypothetical protein
MRLNSSSISLAILATLLTTAHAFPSPQPGTVIIAIQIEDGAMKGQSQIDNPKTTKPDLPENCLPNCEETKPDCPENQASLHSNADFRVVLTEASFPMEAT